MTGSGERCPARGGGPEHCGQHLRGPKDGLRVESSVRISREKRAPIAVETSSAPQEEVHQAAACDDRLDIRRCGEETPKRNRRLRRLALLRRLPAIANQTPTSYSFPMHCSGTAPRHRCIEDADHTDWP